MSAMGLRFGSAVDFVIVTVPDSAPEIAFTSTGSGSPSRTVSVAVARPAPSVSTSEAPEESSPPALVKMTDTPDCGMPVALATVATIVDVASPDASSVTTDGCATTPIVQSSPGLRGVSSQPMRRAAAAIVSAPASARFPLSMILLLLSEIRIRPSVERRALGTALHVGDAGLGRDVLFADLRGDRDPRLGALRDRVPRD